MAIVDKRAMAAVEPMETYQMVDNDHDFPRADNSDDHQDELESDWTTDSEGWEDEAKELNDNVRSR